jgi:hypothetical protein
MVTGIRQLLASFSQVTGFLLLSVGMGFLYSRVLPDALNSRDWVHSLSVGVLIIFSFLAGSKNA